VGREKGREGEKEEGRKERKDETEPLTTAMKLSCYPMFHLVASNRGEGGTGERKGRGTRTSIGDERI